VSAPDIERLRAIRTFPSLIKYLRDELDWPIEVEDFEEMTFDYEPEELGLDPKTAAKIDEIKQLRPLVTNQPWGIFFIKFEPKRLPVVVLRRILSQLVVKKRASSRRTDRVSWHLNDLLFISAYGEEHDRAITFAHFAQDADSAFDLPVLKVLGWDGGDTVLHLADAHRTLNEKLRWPVNPENLAAWRDQWAGVFTLRHREVISTTQELVEELAKLAISIRKRADAILSRESDRGPMRRLYGAFKTALIHDLSEDDFADVIAQTISYGLLAARFSSKGGISIKSLVEMIPPTNPFLRELLAELLAVAGRKKGAFDFDELGIQDVVDLLNQANAEAVKSDFGNRTRNEDPVIHFYEHFLKAYDKKKKVQRGVFFTPQPVVSYIVRSVHELLQTEFGLEDGLADTTTWGEMTKRIKDLKIPDGAKPDYPFVLILDPATGTATFLVEVIEVIFTHLQKKWVDLGKKPAEISKLWNEYVPKNLLPRLYGYELMMAPYTIAHMKLALKLQEINARLGQPDYQFMYKDRAHIYLTNSLEPAGDDKQGVLEGIFPALAHEAAAVNRVKRGKRFTVIIGNPPYSNFGQLNKISFILTLLESYKRDLNEKKINLDDDFIKFIRFSQHQHELSGTGVAGLITNNVYFDGLTHRRMREHLFNFYSTLRVLDLHGNVSAKETTAGGTPDGNVFDIKQGVGIIVMCRIPGDGTCQVSQQHLFGTREVKYKILLACTTAAGFTHVDVLPPHFMFTSLRASQTLEYSMWLCPAESASVVAYGIQTKQDALFIAFTRQELEDRMRAVLRDFAQYSSQQVAQKHGLGASSGWSVAKLQGLRFTNEKIRRILYRPFDLRFIYYDVQALGRARYQAMQHMLSPGRENVGLILMRQVFQDVPEYSHFGVTRDLIDERTFYSNRGGTYLVPMQLLRVAEDGHSQHLFAREELNLPQQVLSRISGHEVTSPPEWETFLRVAYSIWWSPHFRRHYVTALKVGFPRLPVPVNSHLVERLIRLGGELVALHLMESPKLNKHITKWIGGKAPEIEKVAYSKETVWIDKTQTEGFSNVPENVWNFHIGGYQVCEKWLKDRKGRTLSNDDIEHYQKIVVALSETIRIMSEIDEVIEEHGGWYNAFTQGDSEIIGVKQEPSGTDDGTKSSKQVASPHQGDSIFVTKTDKSEEPKHRFAESPDLATTRPDSDELDREDLICLIRQEFSNGEEREREATINELARDLGYQRTGTRIYEELDNALRTAVRRGIISNEGGVLQLFVRTIEEYDRNFLKDQFLSSLQGSSWIERKDAIRSFARWMGFRRTGPAIDETARSLINGLIREGKLESDSTAIRKYS